MNSLSDTAVNINPGADPGPDARPTRACAVCLPSRDCFELPGGVALCGAVRHPMPGYRIAGRVGHRTKYVRVGPAPDDGTDPVAAVRAIQQRAAEVKDRREARALLADVVLSGLTALLEDRAGRLAAVVGPLVAGCPDVLELRADLMAVAAAVATLERGGAT